MINDVLSPSQKVFTAYTDKIGYNIFGQTIAVYIMNSIFNASISESMTWEEINNVVSENETVINGNRFPCKQPLSADSRAAFPGQSGPY